LVSLRKIKLHENPLEKVYNVKLKSDLDNNHLWLVKQVIENKNNTLLKLPVKVLLLGNHAVGKSTFLKYFLKVDEKNEEDSTHILAIEPYIEWNKVQAYFYDFGGQDYYHGIYKAFLTNDAINVLFWNSATNTNKFTVQDSNNIGTVNFKRNYWLYQLQYFYTQNKLRTDQQTTEPILLVQTHADIKEEIRDTTNENTKELNIINEFFVSLHKETIKSNKKLDLSLQYLKEELKELIKLKKNTYTKQASIYDVQLIKLIEKLQKNTKQETPYFSITLANIQNSYKKKYKNEPSTLIEQLDQFSKKGMLLFYPHNKKIKNHIWLHPDEVVSDIHSKILSKEIIITHKGRIEKKIFEALFNESDPKLIDLLIENKVIFLDTKETPPKYIIPGYLPIITKEDPYYEFLFQDLQETNLIVKFQHFIPFGLMNRLICFYGANPDKKLYWKDLLLFTTKNKQAKALVQLNFEKLTISISLKAIKKKKNSQPIDINTILKDLFFEIIALYWDQEEELLSQKKSDEDVFHKELKVGHYDDKNKDENTRFKREELLKKSIPDAYLSLDGKNFIKYDQLHTITANEITSYTLNGNDIDISSGKSISLYPFKDFTFNTNLQQMKKIFISYSKKDIAMVNTFQDHLSALKRDGKVGTWYCTELVAGDDWSKEIEQHFKESDIVCFMISPNFMKTDYIFDHEIPAAFNQGKKIIPIILDFCNWQVEKDGFNLSKVSGLPYTAKPIKDFKNENMAWFAVVECIRLLIEDSSKDLNDSDFFEPSKDNNLYKNSQLRTIYERIINGKADS